MATGRNGRQAGGLSDWTYRPLLAEFDGWKSPEMPWQFTFRAWRRCRYHHHLLVCAARNDALNSLAALLRDATWVNRSSLPGGRHHCSPPALANLRRNMTEFRQPEHEGAAEIPVSAGIPRHLGGEAG